MVRRRSDRDSDGCGESVYRLHDAADVYGRCLLCGVKIEPRMRPYEPTGPTPLELAYRRTWDPDWGSASRDTDPPDVRTTSHRR